MVDKSRFKQNYSRYSIEAEYLGPFTESRRIATTNLHAKYAWKLREKSPWEWGIGSTLTHAEGEIRLYYNHTQFRQWSTWRAVAWGLGPFLFIRGRPKVPTKFSLQPELSTGILIYSQRFPEGADIYNFMIRLGISPSVYFPSSKMVLHSSLSIMHVSNGQGSDYHNLGYDNLGGSIGIRKVF